MSLSLQRESQQSSHPNCLVGVIYENADTRALAAKECDRLLTSLWSEHGFEIQWWSFDMLSEARSGCEALEKARAAAVMIFAVRPEGAFGQGVREWVETWVNLRGEREGALIGLLDPSADAVRVSEKYVYLHHVAHRAGMDYLTAIPKDIFHFIPESCESCAERAGQVTGVLDEILHRHPIPSQAMF